MINRRYYCPTCKQVKKRFEVKLVNDTRFYWYECKWCHNPVKTIWKAIEDMLNKGEEK